MHFVLLKVVAEIEQNVANVTNHGMKGSVSCKSSGRLRNLKGAINYEAGTGLFMSSQSLSLPQLGL